MSTFVSTRNSTYEIDDESKRIRRVSGVNDPTPQFEEDGKWHPYSSITDFLGGLFIAWPDGKGTVTSAVVYARQENRGAE